jgi:hypothetical protein
MGRTEGWGRLDGWWKRSLLAGNSTEAKSWLRKTPLKQKAFVKVVLQRPEWIRSEAFRSESPPVQWSAMPPSPHVPDPATGGRTKSDYLSLICCSVSICNMSLFSVY